MPSSLGKAAGFVALDLGVQGAVKIGKMRIFRAKMLRGVSSAGSKIFQERLIHLFFFGGIRSAKASLIISSPTYCHNTTNET